MRCATEVAKIDLVAKSMNDWDFRSLFPSAQVLSLEVFFVPRSDTRPAFEEGF